jgi:murein DD-endopeptidase MepM/ murein hydrolase activator NlpD
VLRALLILLIGVLVGANVVYFAMTRSARDAGMQRDARAEPAERVAQGDRVDPGDAASVAANPTHEHGSGAQTPRSTRPDSSPAPVGAVGAAASNPAGLIVPVRGVAADALVDTYTDARSEGRSHDAIDIMAPAGTPVLAVADGQVEKLFTSDRGGLTVYQFEPSGRYAYYYAHLQSYAPGLHETQRIRRGEVIGYVGSTGNANASAPHLHFAIFQLGPEKRWWEGTAINPYPLLRASAR